MKMRMKMERETLGGEMVVQESEQFWGNLT